MTDDQPPLADYDELSTQTVRDRIRSLPAEQLRDLFEYEKSHANRPLILQLLSARLDQVAIGAEPTPGPAQEPRGAPAPASGAVANDSVVPEAAKPASHDSPTQPAKTPDSR